MSKNLKVALGVIGVLALFRVLPHPPNVTPVVAVALLSGSMVVNRTLAILIPWLAMLIGDLFLGFHGQMWAVYGALALISLSGRMIPKGFYAKKIIGVTTLSSVIFFLVTNFAVWAQTGMYEKTMNGLLLCYTAAIPFFQNALVGNLVFTLAGFAAYGVALKMVSLEVEGSHSVKR